MSARLQQFLRRLRDESVSLDECFVDEKAKSERTKKGIERNPNWKQTYFHWNSRLNGRSIWQLVTHYHRSRAHRTTIEFGFVLKLLSVWYSVFAIHITTL